MNVYLRIKKSNQTKLFKLMKIKNLKTFDETLQFIYSKILNTKK